MSTLIIFLAIICLSVIVKSDKLAPPVNPWVELFGDKLYSWNDGRDGVVEVDTVASLQQKNVVAIYFSASWCGPCKQFTPQLAKFYASMNKKGKKFEVIWISGDRSSDEFVAYYEKMPWLAVPLATASRLQAKLGPKYNLKGIPHLVVLDGHDAAVYTLDGRTKIAQDPYGLEFPWRPRTLMNILPRPVARILKLHLEQLKMKFQMMLNGLMDQLVPQKIIGKLLDKIYEVQTNRKPAPIAA